MESSAPRQLEKRMKKPLVTIEPARKVKVLRTTDTYGYMNTGVVGMTLYYGMKIGTRGDNKTLVKVTDKDNVVRVLTFDTAQVVII